MSIAENLKKARIKAGLSQNQMAELLNVKPRTYGSYERGERDVNTSFLRNFCNALKISSSEILDTVDVFDVYPLTTDDEHDKSPFPALSQREQDLVSAYRLLDDKQQDVIDYQIHTFAEFNEYKLNEK